jgi:hypothetical protein
MNVTVDVQGQKLRVLQNKKEFVAGSQKFVRFEFTLDEDWDNLLKFAQFRQGGVAYNQYLDDENGAYLPAEIGEGTCTMMLYGSGGEVIGTTNYVTFTIDKNNLISDASSTEISESLYQQLVTKINALSSWNGQSVSDLVEADKELQRQINQKAKQSDLEAEVTRAQTAEKKNADAIMLKASQSSVDELSQKVTQLENNEVIAEKISQAVNLEMDRYLTSGKLASMTITDGSIARTKVDSNFEKTLAKADTAMQPSVYDPNGRNVDVYSYAQSKADSVQKNVDAVKDEIVKSYKLTDTLTYTNLSDTIQGAVTLARTYAQALLADYKAFTIKIVDELPNAGESMTFYLLPNKSKTGYDKYWWITDDDGTQKWDVFGSSTTLVIDSLDSVTPDADTDYILKENGGYLYYKYIDGEWRVIAGSLAYVSSTLPDIDQGNAYTDYYVTDQESGSYRFINGAYRVIGGNSYTKDQMDAILAPVKESVEANAQNIESNVTNLSSLSKTVDKIRSDVDNIDTEGYSYYHTVTQDDNQNYVLTLYQVKGSNEEIASQTMLPAGGGGGGGTVTTTLTVERVTPSPLIITTTDSAVIEIDFSSTDADGETIDATYTWKSGSTVLMSGSLTQGRNSFDLSEYVSVGTQKFTLTVTDEGGSTVVKSWTVQKVDIRIESTFNDRYTTAVGRSVSFSYTPYGSVAKTVHFKLDGVEDTVTTSSSGTLQSYTIPAKSHGAHLLEVWITATVNNTQVETAHLYRDIIWYDESEEDGSYKPAVIGCIYRTDYYGVLKARQYDTTPIIYNVYDPSTNYPVVKRYEDDVLISTDTISSSQNVWNYQSSTVGTHTLKLVCRDTTVTIKVEIAELGIDVSPVIGNLEVDFNPTGITNSSADREWHNDKYKFTVSDNFDWSGGGYKTDEKGDTYFLIKAGTSITLDYNMFSGGLNANPSVNGAEMKVIFMVENVQDANAVWMSNVETTVNENTGATVNMGIQMSAHEGWLKTNNASDSDTESGVAATNTYLYMPYSEEDIIEMDINIDVLDRDDSTAKAFVMAYEDGVPSKAFVYDSSDRFYQYTSQPLKIGSDYCDIRIYRLKIYSVALTTEDIMRNFIADSRDSTTMLARYDRNSIYYNRETGNYTPYSGEGELTPERLAPIIPNVKVLMLETDHFTTSKKVFVKSSLRCIHAPGGSLYPGDEYYDNWLFENGWHSGQGTTSDNYGNSGRNQDYLFNCDGVHKPSDKIKNPEPDYISQVTLGYNTENAYTEKCNDWKGNTGKVALTRTSVPNNFFNLKVNIASSDNVNNALLQKRYNDFLPYISPAAAKDSKVKNDMEFVPAVVFIRETNADISTHNEFLDTQWHFYALGNLGDSKKTDYTRAYDPEDMNEFTIEISDNTKNNAVFQSGVYLDSSGNRCLEKFTLTEGTDDDGNKVYTPVSVAKPDSFVYPITQVEWENKDNMRHWCLYNEGFDGDHSFEPRYACCGDYRDGKLVNDTSGRGKAQLVLNNEVWRAFYRWVVTASDEEFVQELDQWCVRSAVEFFYAFTHIYTMMDNRAKNTFWHFAKTGTYRQVARPVKELLHVYAELSSDGSYTTTKDTSITAGKTYYTQYAFDLWDYDNDTALGINNNGELIFPYGKEDGDYNIEGNPASGYVFNGATSVFWCRLRDLLASEITSVFSSVASECFSANDLINQFDSYQECYPEEIWRLDIQRKYIRTFTGESIDNSKPKHDVQYLRDMMQGRKKYQRRQWMRDQEIYFGTKALMNTVVGDNNRITFRCYTPTGDVAVPPDYTLRITPYSDMYVSVMFGNGGTQQVRAKAGVEYKIECPLSAMDDTQVTIYGANRIAALNDLSACYIAANNFSMASKLRKLVLGNTTRGYSNSRLTSLTLGSNELLEELDIRNCANLTGSLNLAQCSNLLKLYAEGTKITGVIFATNGKVRLVHLPETINTLTMRNLNDLTDFDCTLAALETLTLEGGTLDSLDIVTKTISTLQVLNLYNINWTVGDTVLLNKMVKLFYSLVTGSCYVSGSIRLQEISKYKKAWSDLEVTYNSANLVPQFIATYVNKDGSVLHEEYVDRGSVPPDPVAEGWISTPTAESTEQYDFTYTGWDNITGVMLTNRTITAQYSETIRKYTITWYSRSGVSLGSKTAVYGAEVVYDGEIPTNTSEENTYVYNVFTGWDKSTGFIHEDVDVYAVWDRGELPPSGKDLKDMSVAEIYGVCASEKMDEYFEMRDYFDLKMGNDLKFSNVRSELLCENTYFDGTNAVDKKILLFDEDSPSFTLAIDFEFNKNDERATLLSCYEENGSEGFRLYLNGNNPVIEWGDKKQQVGYGYIPGLCVIRHIKGSNSLFLYAFHTAEIMTRTDTDVKVFEIVRSRSTNTKSTLCLGGIKYSDGFDYCAKGWINWCKIWYEDLGGENAKTLAAWTHETWRMEYCGSSRYRLAGDTSKKSNASFICNNVLRQKIQYNNAYDASGGWHSMAAYVVENERVYKAMPVQWRTIIKKVKVNAKEKNGTSNVVTSETYLYPPARVEMDGTTDTLYTGEGYHIPWFVSNATRVKFLELYVDYNPTIYTDNTDPTQLTSNHVKEGDFWLNNNVYYRYISDEKWVTRHERYLADSKKAIGNGYWMSASYYTERTHNQNAAAWILAVSEEGYTLKSLAVQDAVNQVICFSL